MAKRKPTLKSKRVILQYDLEGELVEVYPSITKAADTSKVNVGLISQACRKMIKSAGGYHWQYATIQEILITHNTPNYEPVSG